MEYEIKPLTPEDAEYIEDRVNECVKLNTPMGHTEDEEELVLKLENDEGVTIGGSILEFGGCEGAQMQLSMLWVDERYRGKGLGSTLIRESERIATERGCCISRLCTLDFQAPDLYKKHGYTVYAAYEDRPRKHTVYYMSKRLRSDVSAAASKNACEMHFTVKLGTEDDAKIIARGLKQHDDLFAPSLHKAISINKKLVDKNGEMIAGIAAGVDGWDGCYIANMYVKQSHRNRGIGSLLFREVEREARENGAYMLVANAFDWNVGFFKKNGCTEAGALKCEPQGHIIYELMKQL